MNEAALRQTLRVTLDSSWWSTLRVDANGYVSYDSLDAGQYVIGIRLGALSSNEAGGGRPPTASLYYPDVHNFSAATAIALRRDEKRDNIDFTVSAR